MAEQNHVARLKNKVVIVTGGAQGIGKGIAEVFDEVGASIKGTGVGEIIYMHCDMRKEAEIKNIVEEIVKRFGRIDCLVNNVGWSPAGIWTPLVQSVMNAQEDPQRFYELNCTTTQLNRMGEPREIGLAALFLAVDATFTTGTEFHCSGGSEIGYGVKGHELV